VVVFVPKHYLLFSTRVLSVSSRILPKSASKYWLFEPLNFRSKQIRIHQATKKLICCSIETNLEYGRQSQSIPSGNRARFRNLNSVAPPLPPLAKLRNFVQQKFLYERVALGRIGPDEIFFKCWLYPKSHLGNHFQPLLLHSCSTYLFLNICNSLRGYCRRIGWQKNTWSWNGACGCGIPLPNYLSGLCNHCWFSYFIILSCF